MSKKFWTTDWFAGAALTLLFLVLFLMSNRPAWVDTLEGMAYDFGVRASSAAAGAEKTAAAGIPARTPALNKPAPTMAPAGRKRRISQTLRVSSWNSPDAISSALPQWIDRGDHI